MKKWYQKSIKIRFTVIIFITLLLLSIGVLVWFILTKELTLATILGGLFSGLLVAIIQFVISWHEYSSADKLKELKINQVLINRDKRDFYEDYIKSAEKEIDMMGVTGSRFIEHFANEDINAPDNAKVLLTAISKGVKIRVLVPKKDFLQTASDKGNESIVYDKYKNITSKYGENFQVKYFSHIPAHSIFKVDDECIVGPIFPDVSSKYTPALYLKNDSPFAEKYLKYFNDEWAKAEKL